jgi:DMSO/TMAO reductase YedYZ molybdopterin-dependent catalytic subunit
MRSNIAVAVLVLMVAGALAGAAGCGGSDSGAKSTKSGSNWDAALDNLDKIVDQTIAINRKLKAGDMSAAAEMASLSQKYIEANDNLEKARGRMTPAQTQRYLAIVQKYAKGISE